MSRVIRAPKGRRRRQQQQRCKRLNNMRAVPLPVRVARPQPDWPPPLVKHSAGNIFARLYRPAVAANAIRLAHQQLAPERARALFLPPFQDYDLCVNLMVAQVAPQTAIESKSIGGN